MIPAPLKIATLAGRRWPHEAPILFGALLLVAISRLAAPGLIADGFFATVAGLLLLAVLRDGVVGAARPTLWCFVALFALYGLALLRDYSFGGMRHAGGILFGAAVFLYCYGNSHALLTNRSAAMLAIALALLAWIYLATGQINPNSFVGIAAYIALTLGLIAILRRRGAGRAHAIANGLLIGIAVAGTAFGYRSLAVAALIALAAYWSTGVLLRGKRWAWLPLTLFFASLVPVAVFVTDRFDRTVATLDQIGEDVLGGRFSTGRGELWTSAWHGIVRSPWLGNGPGALVTGPAAWTAAGEISCLAGGNPGLRRDCRALLDMRDTLIGDASVKWKQLKWNTSYPIAAWPGVRLGGDPPRVVELALPSLGLAGNIPPTIGELDQLESLRLNNNYLRGAIPREIGRLTNLRRLALNSNFLSGEVPDELGLLTNLEELWLKDNFLSNFPPSIGQLEALRILRISHNDRLPRVPPELRNVPDNDINDRLFCHQLPAADQGLLRDCRLLLAVRDELAGTRDLNWSEAMPIRHWQGVRIGGQPIRVTGLALPEAGLNGNIPPRLGQLDALEELRLNNNLLTGVIPDELARLSELRSLVLNVNLLTGPIPVGLGRLASLRELWLKDNRLTGTIPRELADLSNLGVIRVSKNHLDLDLAGSLLDIPDHDFLDDVVCLGVRGRQISPPVPLAKDCAILIELVAELSGSIRLNWSRGVPIGRWVGVKVAGGPARVVALDLTATGINGRIPERLGKLADLRRLALGFNALRGSIPHALSQLASLEELELQGNRLTGPVPRALAGLAKLTVLRLAGNDLEAPVPEALLAVADNDLADEWSCPVLPNGSSATRNDCAALLWSRDALAGSGTLDWHPNAPLDVWQGVVWGGRPKRVVGIHLDRAGLDGYIPVQFQRLDALQVLTLGDNQISGLIPPWLGKLAKLRHLDLSDNALTGPIPAELAGADRLRELRLHGNPLKPPLPAAIAGLPNLTLPTSFSEQDKLMLLRIRDTLAGEASLNWSDQLPLHQWQGIRLTRGSRRVFSVDLRGTGLTGSIPPEFGELDQLTELRLAGNRLSGPIPSSLGQLHNLRLLVLTANRLSGEVPPALGNLVSLEELWLRDNQLIGNLPASLGQLPKLRVLRVAANDFEASPPAALYGVADNDLDDTVYCVPSQRIAADLLRDCRNLIAMRDELAGDGALNWNPSVPLGRWRGVILAGEPRRVSGLRLNFAGLNGRIPARVAELDQLVHLHLSVNRLEGSIPRELRRLTRLSSLLLNTNRLRGTVPAELAELPRLHVLRVRGNDLGDFPPALFTIPDTDLYHGLPCRPDSETPASLLRDCTTLRKMLQLKRRWWRHSVDRWEGVRVGGWPPRIVELDLTKMGARGRLPAALGDLTALRRLALGFNALRGPVPDSFSNLTQLAELELQGNDLSGPWPEFLGKLPNLKLLLLADNDFTGQPSATLQGLALNSLDEDWHCPLVPFRDDLLRQDCSNLLALRDTLAGSKALNWRADVELSDWQGVTVRDGRVRRIDLRGSGLDGSLPRRLGLMDRLEVLDLGRNRLAGGIPADIGRLPLAVLMLDHNRLTGPIPPTLTSLLSTLQEVSLDGNHLTQEFPSQASSLSDRQLAYFHKDTLRGPPAVGGNGSGSLSAAGAREDRHPNVSMWSAWGGEALCPRAASPTTMPSSIARDCATLLDMRPTLLGQDQENADWNWSATTPIGFWRGVTVAGDPLRVVALHLADAGLRGELPTQIGMLDALVSLRLEHNELGGTIPSALGELTELRELALHDNALRGPIPGTLAKLRHLELVDLSGNSLDEAPNALAAFAVRPRDDAKRPEKDLDLLGATLPNDEAAALGALQEAGPPCDRLPPEHDCARLLEIRDDLAGDAELNWSADIPPTAWQGVRWRDDRVVALELPQAGLTGQVPRLVHRLIELRVLTLNDNRLSGTIPPQLAKLHKLLWLRLDGNQLTGAIPQELATVRSLQRLRLDANRLTGAVPAGLVRLPELSTLRLAGNRFSTCVPPLPPTIADRDPTPDRLCEESYWRKPKLMEDAAVLMTTRDALWGTASSNWDYAVPIAEWEGVLTEPVEEGMQVEERVVALDLQGLGLDGHLLPILGKLDRMKRLRLDGNSLQGEVPPEFTELTSLRELSLRKTELTGEIPEELLASPLMPRIQLSGSAGLSAGDSPSTTVGARLKQINAFLDPSDTLPLVTSAHNLYLQVGFQVGLAGVVVLLLLCVFLVRALRPRAGDLALRRYMAACVGLVVVHSSFDVYLFQSDFTRGVVAWILLGLGLGEVNRNALAAKRDAEVI